MTTLVIVGPNATRTRGVAWIPRLGRAAARAPLLTMGFRNRIAILVGWARNPILSDRPIRLAVGAADREESANGTGVGESG